MKGCREKIKTLLVNSFISYRLHAIVESFVFCWFENAHCESVSASLFQVQLQIFPLFYYSSLLLFNFADMRCSHLFANKEQHPIRSFLVNHELLICFVVIPFEQCKQPSATFPNVEKALITVTF